MHIDDATSTDGHSNNAVVPDFAIANAKLHPDEVDEYLAFIAVSPPAKLRAFWNSQLTKVADYVDDTMGVQKIWDNAAPPEITSATGRMESVAISALLDNYGMGGSN